MQARKPDCIKVIDVSHHQEEIDWPKVAAAGVKGAFIKTSEGTGFIDPMLVRNARGADAVGIAVGYYHYCTPEKGNTPEAEAAHFTDTVKGLPRKLPLVLDVEGKAGELGREKLTKWCAAFLEQLTKLTKAPVMVYTGAAFADSFLGAELAKYPLWVAHYGVVTPRSNKTWSEWCCFQHTNKGKVDGIAGNVDVNAMERAFFEQFVPPAGVQPPGPEYTAKIVVNDQLVGYGRIVDGRLEAPIADVLKALGIKITWNNDQKKLYIYK